jgi:hypothetical protein
VRCRPRADDFCARAPEYWLKIKRAREQNVDQESESRNQRSRRALLWALAPATIVGAVALGATGWAAASSSPSAPAAATASPSPSDGTHHGDWGGWRGHRPGWGWAGAGFGGALHGECVSAKEGGGTQTTVFQRGTVTDVTANSVTVRSSDGFSQRYAANGDLLVNGDKKGTSGLTKNKEIFIMGLKEGSTVTAQRAFEIGH